LEEGRRSREKGESRSKPLAAGGGVAMVSRIPAFAKGQ